jgi:hypothetical protein
LVLGVEAPIQLKITDHSCGRWPVRVIHHYVYSRLLNDTLTTEYLQTKDYTTGVS